jgi:hypothetical protein
MEKSEHINVKNDKRELRKEKGYESKQDCGCGGKPA